MSRLLPAPSSAQDLPHIRRRDGGLNLLISESDLCSATNKMLR